MRVAALARLVRPAGVGLLVLALAGCMPKTRPSKDPVAQALLAADRTWGARATTGLDRAEMAYTSLLARWPGEPRVWGRLSATAWSRAMVDREGARTWHEAGRETAMRCLLRDPRLEEMVLVRGDTLDADALRGVHRRDMNCLVQAAAHTLMLVRLRGEGARLDLDDVAPLLDRADALVAGGSGTREAEPSLRRWARASLLVARREAPEVARGLMLESVALGPGQWFYVVEATRAFPDLEGSLVGAALDPEWAIENSALGAAVEAAGAPPGG